MNKKTKKAPQKCGAILAYLERRAKLCSALYCFAIDFIRVTEAALSAIGYVSLSSVNSIVLVPSYSSPI